MPLGHRLSEAPLGGQAVLGFYPKKSGDTRRYTAIHNGTAPHRSRETALTRTIISLQPTPGWLAAHVQPQALDCEPHVVPGRI